MMEKLAYTPAPSNQVFEIKLSFYQRKYVQKEERVATSTIYDGLQQVLKLCFINVIVVKLHRSFNTLRLYDKLIKLLLIYLTDV